MSDDRVKIIGYAKRTFLNDGVEYRNFSDDLVGNQQTESNSGSGSNSNFTLNNFVTTTNFDGKISRLYDTKKYSDYITLQSLDLNVETSKTLLNNNINVVINMDKTNLSNFAYFGSATEFVRVSLENIITLWPASLYITPTRIVNDNTVVGYTVTDYEYDTILNVSKFKVDTNFITNKFSINYQKNGTIVNTFNEGNDIRNLTANFSSYSILVNDINYPVIGYEGSTNQLDDFITFEVEGDPFKVANGSNLTLKYHIKPKEVLCEEFFNSLNNFESNLLNRLVIPIYTSEYEYIVESEDGVLISKREKLTWPVTDGYNIDFNTNQYSEFVTRLVDISKSKDLTESNLMARFLTSESISDFDTIPTCDGNMEETSGQKMNKTLKIYGREFDEIKKYIDGISYVNVVTYDKKGNTPDQLVKYLARVLGWGLVSSVLDEGIVSSYLEPKSTQFNGQSRGLTTQEADVEMWRRLILNSAWIWKSKGTRKAVEFFFKFIGAPDGLINFNEYVYNVKKPIDMDIFMATLENNGLDTDLSLYNVDSEGYPKFLPNSSDMYFQKGGQWYRETGGSGATQHVSGGNNPHVGPYDNGREYINQLYNIIPNFEPFTLTSTTLSNNEMQLFTNYEDGLFNQYSGDVYVNVIDTQGASFDSVVSLNSSIINDPCPTPEETDCGCDIEEDDQSLKIEITNKGVCDTTLTVDCDVLFNEITFDQDGEHFLFDYKVYDINGNTSTTIKKVSEFGPKECCLNLQEEGENGKTYYHEIFQRIDTSDGDFQLYQAEPTNCGYLCCLSKGREEDIGLDGCGCTLSCQWQLTSKNFGDMVTLDSYPGLSFLTFNDPSGVRRLVNKADSCFCHPLTKPIWIIDEDGNDEGYACSMESTPRDANLAFVNFNDIFETYKGRSNGTLDCKGVINTESIIEDLELCELFTNPTVNELTGVVTFTYEGIQTTSIPRDCCLAAGFTPPPIPFNPNEEVDGTIRGACTYTGSNDLDSGCLTYTIKVKPGEGSHIFKYKTCGGSESTITLTSNDIAISICSEVIPSTSQPRSGYDMSVGGECSGDEGILPVVECFVYNLEALDPGDYQVSYTNCDGGDDVTFTMSNLSGPRQVCSTTRPVKDSGPGRLQIIKTTNECG